VQAWVKGFWPYKTVDRWKNWCNIYSAYLWAKFTIPPPFAFYSARWGFDARWEVEAFAQQGKISFQSRPAQ